MKKFIKNKALLSFLLSTILGLLIILPSIIIGDGIFTLIDDYNLQQVPFGMLMNNAIRNGEIFWTWSNELGSNFIATFSFYNLFSPFNLITIPFKTELYPYLCGPLLILKYGIAGLTSYLFLKRYVKNKNYAVIGSLLYSFSGYQLTNMLFHFHDAVALFPLILYTLDNLVYDDKKYWFSLTVFLLAITNWFFFVGTVIFTIIYFLVKVLTKEYKITIKKFFQIILEGLIGVLLSAFVLIPTFLFTLSNPRLGSNWTLSTMLKFSNVGIYLELLRSFLFPPETMTNHAFLYAYNWSSVEAYLPLVGIVPALGYYLKNYNKWDSILLITSLIFLAVPILNSIFYLFNTMYYTRWLYMPILVLSLMSIKGLEDKKIKPTIPTILIIVIYSVIIIGILIYMYRTKATNIFYNKPYICAFIITALFSLLATYFIMKIKNTKKKQIIIVILISIYTTLWGNYMIYTYKGNTFGMSDYKEYLNINKYLSIDKNTRTNSCESCHSNLGVVGNFNNIKAFNTNINGSSFAFYNSVDYQRVVTTMITDKELNNFLGAKYIIGCKYDLSNEYELVKTSGPYKLYLNKEHKDLGFILDEYILDEEFSKLETKEKISTINKKVVLNKNQIEKYASLFTEKTNYTLEEIKLVKNGLTAKLDSSKEALMIFTVPYDKGFKAKVNGTVVAIEKVDSGFIAVKVEKGINEIEFTYRPPGLKEGMFLSLFGLLLFICYYTYEKNNKNV